MSIITTAVTQQLVKLEEKINTKSLRERAFLLTAVVILIFMLWRNLVFHYFSALTDEIIANKERLNSQIIQIQSQIENLSDAIKHDSTLELEIKLKAATQKNKEIKQKIDDNIAQLASSGEMMDLLKGLLAEDAQLKVLKLESLADRPVFSEKSDFFIYNKGVHLELEGNYMATVRFLKKMEDTGMTILWDKIIYEVTQYPLAKITLILHTMGTEKGWLHV